ncbi:MAG: serine/threonine protein kinase [Pirellulales bacterium]|nr:serine/threonine protein kinase [Pirellulales bacterium]
MRSVAVQEVRCYRRNMDNAEETSASKSPELDRNPIGGRQSEEAEATVLSDNEAIVHAPKSVSELGKLLEGRQLGDYRLEKFVGGGGMGAVFKALDTTLDRIVAVKVLAGHQSADEEMLRRFRNEAQSAARLNHENIGLVHAVGSSNGWHFIVFEYIEGTNLRDLVRQRGPLTVAAVVDISMQIAAALDHACQRDVTHRDIKPSNILLTPEGRAKLVDMGLARLQHIAGEQDLTVSGITLGTFDYISPEQARDARSADIRSDLYSLGCTMFFMLVGRAPFAEGTMVQKLLQHQQETPPGISDLRTEVPRRLVSAVHKLMSKRPQDRFQHPAALEFELLSIAEEEGFDVTSSRPAMDIDSTITDKNKVLFWPWVAAGLSLIGFVGWTAISATKKESKQEFAKAVNPQRQVLDDTAVVRVVPQPLQPDEFGTISDALTHLSGGGVIEISEDSEYEISPMRLDEDVKITIRGVAGKRPVLRITDTRDSLFDLVNSAFFIDGGHLMLSDIDVHVHSKNEGREVGYFSIFELTNGGKLTCRNSEVVTTALPSEENSDVEGNRIFLARVSPLRKSNDSLNEDVGEGQRIPLQELPDQRVEEKSETVIEIENCVVDGDITCFNCEASTVLSISWTGGAVTTRSRFLTVNTSSVNSVETGELQLQLHDATFVCGQGFARLADVPGQDDVPQMRVIAEHCQFVIPESSVLLEQVGVAEPEAYQRAIQWRDHRGRYEGGRIFRKIDGAGDLIEIDYSSAGQPLEYQGFSGIRGFLPTN